MITKQQETIKYSRDKISVYVSIDYINNVISIVEPSTIGQFREKKYLFSGRGVEYMNGWLNILDVMKEAITKAKTMYEHELAESSKFTEEFIKNLKNGDIYIQDIMESRKRIR